MARRQCRLGWRVNTRGKCGGFDTWNFFSWLLYAGRCLLKFSVDFPFPVFRPQLFFLLNNNFLQSHRGSYTCSKILNTYEHSLLLCTCRKLLSCVYSLQSSKGLYILALQQYISVLYYHVVDQAHVLFQHNSIFYCLVQNYVLCTSIGCFHVFGEKLG